jgi:predicted esterase YcpF (UPF0227 family)
MEKQTPVEWLALRYHHRQGYLSQDDIAEAKAMEKEQIMKAASVILWHNSSDSTKDAEQYYNETYNK